MGVAAVVGTVGSALVGGAAQSSAAKKAASAQRGAAAAANAEQQGFFDVSQQNLKPYIDTGNAASTKISQLEGLNGADSSGIQSTLESLPGYQFAKQQGLKSVQNSATERGLGVSGAAQKGAASYSTGLANQYYNNLLTGLQDTQHTGANAAAGLATNALETGKGIAQTDVGAGSATAAGINQNAAGIANAASGVPSGIFAKTLLQNQSGQNNDPSNNFLAPVNTGAEDENNLFNLGDGFT